MAGTSDRRTSKRRRQAASVPKERRTSQSRRVEQRRNADRVPLELWMEEMAGEDIYFRRTGNVSEGGAYFGRVIPHPLGTLVTLKFALPGDPEMVVARGKVVSAQGKGPGFGMGVRFVNVEGDGAQRIKGYLRNL